MQRVASGKFNRRFAAKLTTRLITRFALTLPVIFLGTGCHSGDPQPLAPVSNDAALFGPAKMRLHPIFTQVKDWTGNGIPDGIEALVEMQDQFGDPTKASGNLILDLYQYKKYDPQRKGNWLAEWQVDLSTLAAQENYWNRTSRTYGLQLAYGIIALDQNYVLTAEFQLSNGKRLFDQLVIEAQIKPEKRAAPDYGLPPSPTTAPATQSDSLVPSGANSLAPAASPINAPGMRMPQP
jgi:hypothetical protein